MKSYSQITFDFIDNGKEENTSSEPSVVVRLKSIKQPEPPAQNTEEPEELPVVEVVDLSIADFIHTQQPAENEQVEVEADEPIIAEKRKSTRGRKSMKTLAAEADLVDVPEDEVLFQKQYYSIGEVSGMFRVNPSLLRFWEAEFDIIQPRKNRKGDRHFRPVDIKNLLLIHDLLRRRKLTIEGAKDFLKKNKRSQERFEMIQSLQKIRSFLLELKASI